MIVSLLLAAALSSVRGDFARDGHIDVARITRQGRVVVSRVAAGRRLFVSSDRFSDPFLEVNERRGWTLTACGKGYELTCRNVPRRLHLSGGELLFGQREATSFVLVSLHGRLEAIQLSD